MENLISLACFLAGPFAEKEGCRGRMGRRFATRTCISAPREATTSAKNGSSLVFTQCQLPWLTETGLTLCDRIGQYYFVRTRGITVMVTMYTTRRRWRTQLEIRGWKKATRDWRAAPRPNSRDLKRYSLTQRTRGGTDRLSHGMNVDSHFHFCPHLPLVCPRYTVLRQHAGDAHALSGGSRYWQTKHLLFGPCRCLFSGKCDMTWRRNCSPDKWDPYHKKGRGGSQIKALHGWGSFHGWLAEALPLPSPLTTFRTPARGGWLDRDAGPQTQRQCGRCAVTWDPPATCGALQCSLQCSPMLPSTEPLD